MKSPDQRGLKQPDGWRGSFRFALAVSLLPFLAPAAQAQPATPPPVASTPGLIKTCLENFSAEGFGACLARAWSQGGWVLAGVAVIIIVFALAARKWGPRAFEIVAEKLLGDAWKWLERRRYLKWAINRYRQVTYDRLGAYVLRHAPELSQAYISLRMAPRADREAMRSKEDLRERGLAPEEAQPVDLAGAISQSPKLAVIGAAGSGKSTLLQWAGLAAASACLGKTLPDDQRAFVAALGGRPLTPVIVPLAEINRIRKKDDQKRDATATTLLDCLAEWVAGTDRSLGLGQDFFQRQLQGGLPVHVRRRRRG